MSIRLEQREGVAVLILDRQEALNALSFDVIEKIDHAIARVSTMEVRALLITGAGSKAFCAGADIKELRDRSLVEQRCGIRRGQQAFAKLSSLPIASIAVINGYAFGGGLELALACTFRLGTRNAKVGLPEIKLGLIPGYGGTQRLPRLIGHARAMEMILTGKTVEAQEAHSIGLINRLIDGDPVEEGLAFAREFTSYSLPVLALAREAVDRAQDLPIHDGLKAEADLASLAYRTADAEEGMAAFAEKRKPVFKDG